MRTDAATELTHMTAHRSSDAQARRLGAALRVALALALALPLLAAAGCRSDLPVVAADKDLEKVKVTPGTRELKLAMSPVETAYPDTADLDKDSSRYPAKIDREKLRDGMRGAIASYGGFAAPVAVPGTPFTESFAAAAAAGAEVLIRPVFERLDCVWVEHNGTWVPNILLFIYAWIPSFWIADEDFGLEGTLALHYYSVASQRELYVKRVEIKDQWSLDDFERGWSWTGIITVPATVNANDWGIVSESLAPLLRFHCERGAAIDAATELESHARSGEFKGLDATVFGVVVGVGKYNAGISGAVSAKSDAAAIEALLKGKAGVPAKNVARIDDDRATYQAIEQLIMDTFGASRPDDTALLYWSGLGTTAPSSREGAPGMERLLLPKDVEPRDLSRTGMSLGKLREILAKVPARRIVVVLDASFGGRRPGSRSLLRGPDAALLTTDEELVRFTDGRDGKDVTLWLASSPGEDAVELEGEGRGLMSYLFEEGASGRADGDENGTVTVRELFDWVERETASQAGIDGAMQQPRIYRAGARASTADAGALDPWLQNAGDPSGAKVRKAAR